MGIKIWILDLKFLFSPSPVNLLPSQTDGTENGRKLFLESPPTEITQASSLPGGCTPTVKEECTRYMKFWLPGILIDYFPWPNSQIDPGIPSTSELAIL